MDSHPRDFPPTARIRIPTAGDSAFTLLGGGEEKKKREKIKEKREKIIDFVIEYLEIIL